MRNYLPATVASFLVAIALVWRMQAQVPEPKPASDRPLWETDLRQFGYKRFPQQSTRPLQLLVDFTDADQLAVGWVMPDSPDGQKNAAVPEPAHLNVIVLDSKTGTKQGQAKWPTSDSYFSLPLFFGIPDGELLICNDDALRLLSPSLEVVREHKLPDRARWSDISLQHSPSGRTLLVSTPSEHTRRIEILDVKTFAILSSWQEEPTATTASKGSVSDQGLVGYCAHTTEICLRPFDGEWRPLRPKGSDTKMENRQRIPAAFLSDDILAIQGNPITVTTTHGLVLFQITPPKNHWLGGATTSAGSARFALIDDRFRGLRSEPLDMYPFLTNDRVWVYSIKDKGSIFSIKLKGTSPWTPWDFHDNFIALSPDGASLAVVSDGILRVYSLPSDSTGQR